MFVFVVVCGCVCVYVSEEKDDEERSQFVLLKEGREKKKAQNVKINKIIYTQLK